VHGLGGLVAENIERLSARDKQSMYDLWPRWRRSVVLLEEFLVPDLRGRYRDTPSVLLLSDLNRTTLKCVINHNRLSSSIGLLSGCVLVALLTFASRYLTALGVGVPCVHYSWLQHCASRNLVLPYTYTALRSKLMLTSSLSSYLLPAGFSMSKHAQVLTCFVVSMSPQLTVRP
jgi:hypothetical protein